MLLEKITAEQLIEKGVVSAPDKLEGDPQENKYRFDRLVAETVAPIVNACIDTVNSVEMQEETIKAAEEERKAAEQAREEKETGYVAQAKAAASAAGTAAENAAGSEAEAAASAAASKKSETNAEESARKAAQAALGQIPDGSLEPVKFSPASRSMMVRENLLDNSHFYAGALVDQRGGYVVKPGARYFSLSDSTVAGTTDKYYKVDAISTDGYANAIFTIDGTQYYTTKANYVRGYAGAGYTIDRWKLSGADSVVLVENDFVRLKSANAFYQPIENPEKFAGKTVTFSLLIECVAPGVGHFGFVVDNNWLTSLTLPQTVGEKTVASVTVNFPESVTKISAWYYGAEGTDYKIYAAKLELGDTQTLAHLENGEWVLNEIPNYAEELAKCQRYRTKTNAAPIEQRIGIYTSSFVECFIPLCTAPRIAPSVANINSLMESGAISIRTVGNVIQTGFTCVSTNTTVNGLWLRFQKDAHGLTDACVMLISALLDFNL